MPRGAQGVKRGPNLLLRGLNRRKAHPKPRAPLSPEQQPPPGARAIQLTKGWACWVDEADYPAVSQWIWTLTGGPSTPAGHPLYAARMVGGRHEKTHAVWMHREIMRDALPPGVRVDHRKHRHDIRVVDNRRSNLRTATDEENTHNSRKHRIGTSPFKGITKTKLQWQTRVRALGKNQELGCYRRPEEGAVAYDAAALYFFGDYACTNYAFPESKHSIHGACPLTKNEVEAIAWGVMRRLAVIDAARLVAA